MSDHRFRPSAPTLRTGAPHRSCQWIAGDPRTDATKCGAPVRLGSSYCPEHYERSIDRRTMEGAVAARQAGRQSR